MVTAGKDKGRKGIVNKVIIQVKMMGKCAIQQTKLLVDGINRVKKHKKRTADGPGSIQEQEAPIHISNVAIFNAATGKADRVGFKTLEDGRKVRIFKSTAELVDI